MWQLGVVEEDPQDHQDQEAALAGDHQDQEAALAGGVVPIVGVHIVMGVTTMGMTMGQWELHPCG